jgi:hypothetical protein
MKKSIFFCAALFACAFAFQSCDKVDNPSGKPLEPTKAVIDNGSDLKDVIAKFAKDGVVTLPAGVELTLNEEIELTEPLAIIGDKEKPAKIVAKAGFVISSDFVLEGVEINAEEVKTPFIKLATYELQGEEKAKNLGLIAFINSKIFDLKYQFIYANKQPYLVDCINVQKSIIAIDGANKKTTFDFNGGGNVAFLGIDESTISSVPTVNNNGGFFSSQSGKEVTDLGGTTQTFAISNSTLYNIANGKTVNTLRKNSQAYQKFAVKNSIIVDSGKSGQFLKGLNAGNAGKDTNWEVEGNCFNWGGEVIAEQKIGSADDNIKNSIDEVIVFADAEKGNFTQKQTSAGDPRWIANAQ